MILWCDSQIVLCWLNKSPANLEIFVGSRVREIHQLTPPIVSTNDNLVDLASRGVTPSDLQSTNLWWHGPVKLQQNEDIYEPPE